MTIAAGFLSLHGAVICSDSEESTTTGQPRTDVRKVFMHSVPGGMVLFAGAGLPTLTDAFETALLRSLRGTTEWNWDQNQLLIGDALHEIYRQHVWPSGQTSAQLAAILILVADSDARLFKVDQDTVLLERNGYACVGIGAKAAERVCRPLFYSGDHFACDVASIEQLEVLASYVIWVAKETTEGVGGPTQMISYTRRNGVQPSGIGYSGIKPVLPTLEQAFRRVDGYYAQYFRALAHPTADHESAAHYFGGMSRQSMRLWHEWWRQAREAFRRNSE